jgi:hypothetical protein
MLRRSSGALRRAVLFARSRLSLWLEGNPTNGAPLFGRVPLKAYGRIRRGFNPDALV